MAPGTRKLLVGDRPTEKLLYSSWGRTRAALGAKLEACGTTNRTEVDIRQKYSWASSRLLHEGPIQLLTLT